MKTLLITKDDLTNGKYTGATDVTNFDGHIEIAENLGWVHFEKSIKITGQLTAKAGSSIEAGESIKAGWGIEAGSSIKAGESIKAGWDIEAGSSIISSGDIPKTFAILSS